MSQFSFEDILNSVELVDIEIGSDGLPEFEEPELGIDQSLELIKLGLNPYQPLHENSQAKAIQTNFLKSIFKQQPAARATRGKRETIETHVLLSNLQGKMAGFDPMH